MHPIVRTHDNWNNQVDYTTVVGKYTYSTYWRSWDKIIGVAGHCVVVQGVDNNGAINGPARSHCTPIHKGSIADFPFDPYAK